MVFISRLNLSCGWYLAYAFDLSMLKSGKCQNKITTFVKTYACEALSVSMY